MNLSNPNYRYLLDESSKKFQCPHCDKRRFVRFVDQQTKEYLPAKYGRCDRESSCGYFLNPYKERYGTNDIPCWQVEGNLQNISKPTDYIDEKYYLGSLKQHGQNTFIKYLHSLFDSNTVNSLINAYKIGTSKHWDGATVFWQIDIQGRIRTGKVMLYDTYGHRVKDPYPHINWVHSLLYESYNLQQCFLGEHLLTDDKRIPVAIVESEKTAIISSVYFPEFSWLAAGSKSNLKPERCKCLMGRSVTLFPDLGAYQDWQQKAASLSYFCDIRVSKLLEEYSDRNDKKEGFDLADYLIQYDLDEFKRGELVSKLRVVLNEKGYPASWDNL